MMFLYGFLVATLLILSIAFVDEKYLLGKGVTTSPSMFKTYLVASCWEILFVIGGIFIGKYIL